MNILPILSALVTFSLLAKVQSQGVEEKLAKQLMEKLTKQGSVGRPVNRASEVVSVKLGLTVLRVDSTTRNSAEVDCWLQMSWNDPRLAWGKWSNLYAGLSSFAVPADSLWLPDIRPYNVLGFQPDKEGPIRPVIVKDGTIFYVLPARIRFQCRGTSGTLSCQVKLGSWVYNSKQVNIKLAEKPIDLTEFTEGDSDWSVSGGSAVTLTKTYPCCPEPYTSVEYKVTFGLKKT